ncbi:hypothetical protein OH492_16355 [Vibrio chagasii]|nr:hypothetical protein [Vibrio chagasii]
MRRIHMEHYKASNGAEHAVSSTLYLGLISMLILDGQPGALSNGDDLMLDGNDDDGITLLTNLEIGLDSLINVNVVGNGYPLLGLTGT